MDSATLQKRLEANRERGRKWRAANKERNREHQAKYRANNREKCKNSDRKWRTENPEKAKDTGLKSRTKLKHKVVARCAERYASKKRATPPWLNRAHRNAIETVYEMARALTEGTGVAHQVDHIVPLRSPFVCGLHVPWNLQVLTAKQNFTKRNDMTGDSFELGWATWGLAST